MTNNLIAFYTTAVKAILEDEAQETKEFVVMTKTLKTTCSPKGEEVNNQPHLFCKLG